jgi:hypothetical protein
MEEQEIVKCLHSLTDKMDTIIQKKAFLAAKIYLLMDMRLEKRRHCNGKKNQYFSIEVSAAASRAKAEAGNC